jgi:hypothetical protein
MFMKKKPYIKTLLVTLSLLCASSFLQVFALSMAPPQSLEERVGAAEKIFVFKLESIGPQDGAFKTAILIVEDAIQGCEKGEKVKVCWTGFIEGRGFIPKVGDTGIAIVGDKHQDAYWFRADKVEPLERKAEIVKLLAKKNNAQLSKNPCPTFVLWIGNRFSR